MWVPKKAQVAGSVLVGSSANRNVWGRISWLVPAPPQQWSPAILGGFVSDHRSRTSDLAAGTHPAFQAHGSKN